METEEKIRFRINKNPDTAEMTIQEKGINSKMDLKDMAGKIKMYFEENCLEITKKNNYYRLNIK